MHTYLNVAKVSTTPTKYFSKKKKRKNSNYYEISLYITGCNVNARHLRIFKKDQIHQIIPKSELGILAEFEYLLKQWQISNGYTPLYSKIQLNRVSESNNFNSPKHKTQTQSNVIIIKEEPQAPSNIAISKEKIHTLSNNEPVVVAKQPIDIKPMSINLQGLQISSAAMVVVESDELLTVLDSNDNSSISNAKSIQFDEEDEEKPSIQSINQPVVVAKQSIDIKPISINFQGPQISSPAMVVVESDELLTVQDSNENSTMFNVKVMKFDEEDEEKPSISNNNQPDVIAKQPIDIKPMSINLQGPQISSPAMVVDRSDESVLGSDDNSNISNARIMKFVGDDEEKFVSYFNNTRNL